MQELLIQQETFHLHIGETFLASRDRLREHPENMRRYYRHSDLNEMAASLAAHWLERHRETKHGVAVTKSTAKKNGSLQHVPVTA